MTGYTYSFEDEHTDLWILKLDCAGKVEWQKTYGGDMGEGGGSIDQTRDGGFIVGGCTTSFGAGEGDTWVLKLNPLGEVEWEKTYGGVFSDGPASIKQTTDGGFIMAGDWETSPTRRKILQID